MHRGFSKRASFTVDEKKGSIPMRITPQQKSALVSNLASRRSTSADAVTVELANLAKQKGKPFMRNPLETGLESATRGIAGGAVKGGLTGAGLGSVKPLAEGTAALLAYKSRAGAGNINMNDIRRSYEAAFKSNIAPIAISATTGAIGGARQGYNQRDRMATKRRNDRNYKNIRYLNKRGINNFETGGQILTDKLRNSIGMDGAEKYAFERFEEMKMEKQAWVGKAIGTGMAGFGIGAATSALEQYRDNVQSIKDHTPGALISEYSAPALGAVDGKQAFKKGATYGAIGLAAKGAKSGLKAGKNAVNNFIKKAEEEDYLSELACEVCGYEGKPRTNGLCPNCSSPNGKRRSTRDNSLLAPPRTDWRSEQAVGDFVEDDQLIW